MTTAGTSDSDNELDKMIKVLTNNIYADADPSTKEDLTDIRIKAINYLGDNKKLKGMYALVNTWGSWLAVGYYSSLRDLIELKLVNNPLAIRPLIGLLGKDLDIDLEIKNQVAYSILLQNGLGADELDSAWKNTKDWNSIIKTYRELIKPKWAEIQVKWRRKIAQNLLDLSNQINVHTVIKSEFETYAVTPVARALDKESDSELRESYARILVNIGDRPSIEAMIRAIKGEDLRFNMLDQYYLKPAQEKSIEAKKILNEVNDEAKTTLKYLRWMNIAVFILGLAVLGVGIFVGLVNKNLGTQIAASVAGIGGLAGVIYYLIKNPLDRIQNSTSHLAQIETAFYSFFWNLDVSETYIQSQYVANGILSNEDIGKTIDRVETVSSSAMNLIASYTEEGKELQVSYITALSPPAGKTGSVVSIKGKFNQSKNKNDNQPVIVFDHLPKSIEITAAKIGDIAFTMPKDAISSEEKEAVIWISVIDNGRETNALPFQIIADNKS